MQGWPGPKGEPGEKGDKGDRGYCSGQFSNRIP